MKAVKFKRGWRGTPAGSVRSDLGPGVLTTLVECGIAEWLEGVEFGSEAHLAPGDPALAKLLSLPPVDPSKFPPPPTGPDDERLITVDEARKRLHARRKS